MIASRTIVIAGRSTCIRTNTKESDTYLSFPPEFAHAFFFPLTKNKRSQKKTNLLEDEGALHVTFDVLTG